MPRIVVAQWFATMIRVALNSKRPVTISLRGVCYLKYDDNDDINDGGDDGQVLPSAGVE